MKFQFLGGAQEIGRLGLQVQIDKTRLLFDYGYSVDNPIKFPMFPSKIDALFCSHAHLDHIGLAPLVHRTQPESKIYMTSMTKEIAQLLLRDSIKVFHLNNEPQLYSNLDIDKMYDSANLLEHGQTKMLHQLEINVLNAGHVPGAAMFHIRHSKTNFLFTGDMNLQPSNLTTGAVFPEGEVDTLFIEGTYGNRYQLPRETVVEQMSAKIDEALSNKGRVVIPAFAFGRSQDILLELADRYDTCLDGLANRIMTVFLEKGKGCIPQHSRLDQSLQNCIRVTNSKIRTKALKDAQVIITTGGMLDGGPVLSYLKQIATDPRSKIFITGFQGEGTNGERLEQTGEIMLENRLVKVKAEVVNVKQSAHSDLASLLTFIGKVHPRRVVIMHSEESQNFSRHILDNFPDVEVIVPTIGTNYSIDED